MGRTEEKLVGKAGGGFLLAYKRSTVRHPVRPQISPFRLTPPLKATPEREGHRTFLSPWFTPMTSDGGGHPKRLELLSRNNYSFLSSAKAHHRNVTPSLLNPGKRVTTASGPQTLTTSITQTHCLSTLRETVPSSSSEQAHKPAPVG